MIEEYDFRSDNQDQTDKTYEIALRPKHFKDFAGQPQVVENLSIFVSAAKMREAGASEAELMDFVNTLIDEFKGGGTTVPEEPAQLMHPDGPEGDGVGDLLDILGL